jgi:acetyl-CoA C-acetyltransferase
MTTMNETVILSAVRTPVGKLGGSLSSLAVTTLGAEAVRASVAKSGVAPEDLDYVILGEVIQAGAGQAPARQAMLFAGLPKTVGADTVNKVCASGLLAIANGHRLIQAGDARTVVAGGMESMSNAPYMIPNARFGYKMGNGQLLDSMIHDGLWCPFFHCMMADATDGVSTYLGVSRAQQDEFALRSHKRAIDAHEQGRFADEMIPLKVATKQRGRLIVDAVPVARSPVGVGAMRIDETPQQFVADPKVFSPYLADPNAPFTLVDRDEAPRKDTSLEALAKLKSIVKNGNITAGNAPGVNDAAAALVLAGADFAKAHGLSPLGTVKGHACAAWDPPYLPLVPAMAAQKLLDAHGLKVDDIALWEINEAFAAVSLSSAERLGLDLERVNVDGGAIAIGHPLGASGARIVAHLVHALRRRGGGLGIAAICSGGGQGDALLVEVR